jgi:hypothetical protein
VTRVSDHFSPDEVALLRLMVERFDGKVTEIMLGTPEQCHAGTGTLVAGRLQPRGVVISTEPRPVPGSLSRASRGKSPGHGPDKPFPYRD